MSENEKIRLAKLEARFDTEITHIKNDIHEIKTNHLAHIQLSITDLNSKFVGLSEKITNLRIVDSEQKPMHKLLYRALEYVILALIGVGIAIMSRKF